MRRHCLEHQPDLVGHLEEVGQLLLPGGAYFLLVPDKRYCFDYFIPLSNLAEVLVAHRQQRRMHTLRSVIECRALTTHNDSLRHWQGDHGIIYEGLEGRLQAALEEFDNADGKYIDVHAWYFTPDSASAILSALQSIGLSELAVHRVYPTRYGANEFWIILRKQKAQGFCKKGVTMKYQEPSPGGGQDKTPRPKPKCSSTSQVDLSRQRGRRTERR
jgi:hypothetical protein